MVSPAALDVRPKPAAANWLTWLVVLAALLALPFVASAVGDASITTLATRIVILSIAAASLNLALGYGGMVSFGHAAFLGVGGYAVGMLYSHFVAGTPFLGFIPGTDQLLLTLPAAMLASGLVAAAFGALLPADQAASSSS